MGSVESYTEMNEVLLHMDFVNQNYAYREVTVADIDAYRHQGNLYGLFYLMGIVPELHLYTMHLNGYTNPVDYEGEKLVFRIPVMPPIPN